MKTLEVRSFPVRDIALDKKAAYEDGALRINPGQIGDYLKQDKRLAEVDIHVARPGEDVRIVHVLDIVQPRAKVRGRGTVFPGFLGPPEVVGEGCTHKLDGMAVLAAARFEDEGDELLKVQEGIIDMAGSGAQWSPFSRTVNLVFSFRKAPEVSNKEFDCAMRIATLKAADLLARCTSHLSEGETKEYRLATVDSHLPRIAVICQLASLGPLYDTYLYGRSVEGILPTFIDPCEMMDGAVVSGELHAASLRNPTFSYQENALIEKLYRGHGATHAFAGMILTRGYNLTFADKLRAASMSANLARMLRADGVVITSESGGNSLIDSMMTCRECEHQGMKTTLILSEMAGVQGDDSPFVDFTPEARAIVSVGNFEEMIELPAASNVLGGSRILGSELSAKDKMEVPLIYMCGANNQLGAFTVQGRAH
jgi:glycine reductase